MPVSANYSSPDIMLHYALSPQLWSLL